MSKHTPGPWEVEFNDVGESGIRWITGHVTAKAHKYCGNSGPGARPDSVTHVSSMTAADAHLIAAAPDLLAACKEALHLLEPETDAKPMIEAAIAKAEGKART